MSQQDLENENGQEASPLGMSDDDFANLDPAQFEEAESVEDEPVTEDETDEDDDTGESEAGASAEADDVDGDELGEEDPDEDAGNEDEDADPDAEAEDAKDGKPEDGEAEEADKDEADKDKDEPEDKAVDYKAEYDKLMAPFRANGKEMQVKNIDEAMQLMQMGAGFNKKMAGLKPAFKTLKLLENNGLMDESKLSYLIDLDKKNPEAIKKLIKESGIDPIDLDLDTESDYKPETYTVDDRELELDEVLDSISESPTYSKTIDVVSTKWDQASKQTIANNPQLLTVINNHMASGIYDQISNGVERERSFGRLKGLTDIEAYKQVGDAMDAEGKFAGQGEAPAKPTNAGQRVERKPKAKVDDPKLKSKKRAASSTKAKSTAKEPDYNPLNMSDAEFEKQFNESLL